MIDPCAPNTSAKPNSPVRVPGSVLLLLGSARDPANGVELNIRAEAAAMGVHPDRIRLDERLSREEHVLVRFGSIIITRSLVKKLYPWHVSYLQ